jgi:uncharacterized protein DUF2334
MSMSGRQAATGAVQDALPDPTLSLARRERNADRWLPAGKTAAICFSVDDIHPSTSIDPYEAGGDLGRGALGRLARLLERHPKLRVTLFVTPDWRPLGLHPTRRLLAHLPFVGRRMHLARVRRKDDMRIDRFPEFVRYLSALPRAEVAPHGLHHLHPGRRLTVEFQEQDREQCAGMLRRALDIFAAAGLSHVPGFQPPGWNLTRPLARALVDLGFTFVCSARDLTTAATPEAVTRTCALRDFPLLRPGFTDDGRLVHFTHNFQATSRLERALSIVECRGLLGIKAHIFKHGGGHSMLDGLDDAYCNYLDLLFSELDRRFGEGLWWTSFGEIADRLLSAERARSN